MKQPATVTAVVVKQTLEGQVTVARIATDTADLVARFTPARATAQRCFLRAVGLPPDAEPEHAIGLTCCVEVGADYVRSGPRAGEKVLRVLRWHKAKKTDRWT